MSKDELYLRSGDTYELYVNGKRDNGHEIKVNVQGWTCSDTTIAKVDDNGWVRAVKEGICIITAQTEDGHTASCILNVYGVLTYNVTLPADNEIWYTSVDSETVELSSYPAQLVSNTYNNEKGVYTFSSSVNTIKGFDGNAKIESVIIPKTVTSIGSYSLHNLQYAHTLVLSPNISSVGTDAFGFLGDSLGDKQIKHIYFLSEQCPSTGWRVFWNCGNNIWIHYPKGADYSVIEQAAREWEDATHRDIFRMVETEYIYNQ